MIAYNPLRFNPDRHLYERAIRLCELLEGGEPVTAGEARFAQMPLERQVAAVDSLRRNIGKKRYVMDLDDRISPYQRSARAPSPP